MSSNQSFHDRKGRKATERALLAANEHTRTTIRESGRLTSHLFQGAVAAGEILAHVAKHAHGAAVTAAAQPKPRARSKAKAARSKPQRKALTRKASKASARRAKGRR